jgi:hypothetical protein
MTNLGRYVVHHDRHRGHVNYSFPNGQEVSVIPDPHRPLRWEILVDGASSPEPGLTTDEAEARLAELAALPMPEWDGVS